MLNNSIMVLKPYLYEGMFVFDDPATGLVREPFVAGVPEILAALLELNGITLEEALDGFLLTFSANPFPFYQLQAEHVGEEHNGNWYKVVGEPESVREGVVNGMPELEGQRGWLCPALMKYFEKAPQNLYVSVKKA